MSCDGLPSPSPDTFLCYGLQGFPVDHDCVLHAIDIRTRFGSLSLRKGGRARYGEQKLKISPKKGRDILTAVEVFVHHDSTAYASAQQRLRYGETQRLSQKQAKIAVRGLLLVLAPPRRRIRIPGERGKKGKRWERWERREKGKGRVSAKQSSSPLRACQARKKASLCAAVQRKSRRVMCCEVIVPPIFTRQQRITRRDHVAGEHKKVHPVL